MSHISPDFIPVFGDAIRMTREILYTQTAQPFLIAGSGTLGWDQVWAPLNRLLREPRTSHLTPARP